MATVWSNKKSISEKLVLSREHSCKSTCWWPVSPVQFAGWASYTFLLECVSSPLFLKKTFLEYAGCTRFHLSTKMKNIWFDLIWLWFAVLESLVFMWTLMVCDRSMTWSAISLCHITDIWKYLSLGSVVVWSTLSGWLEELNLVLLSWPLQCFREDNFQPETLVWGDVKLCTSTTAVAQCCLISISNNLCNAWFCTLFP